MPPGTPKKPQIPVPNGPGDSEIFEFLKFFLNL